MRPEVDQGCLSALLALPVIRQPGPQISQLFAILTPPGSMDFGVESAADFQAKAVQHLKYRKIWFFSGQRKFKRTLTFTGGLRFEHMGN
jgi:hypothetical protein